MGAEYVLGCLSLCMCLGPFLMVHLVTGLQKYLMSVDSRQYPKQTQRTNSMPFARKDPVHYVLKSDCIF